ncbi:hypothetical protein [Anaerocolumna aminovalerica]|uniref:hypothetical protein n=1 Tax=Anaerocolumna aminovalerica TaxID=1527 RepID=UPI0011418964|nr:hypothetical protein [Anaerocolumna aminovalerica]
MQKRNMEVFFTTLIGNLNEDDLFLGIAGLIECKIKDAMGRQHTINSSFSLIKKKMSLKIDHHVKIIVRVTKFKDVRKEPLTKMENVMSLYEITKAELERVYANDPSLLDVPEPMMYIHDCIVEFEVGDCSNEKYADIARNLISLVTQNKMTLMFQ